MNPAFGRELMWARIDQLRTEAVADGRRRGRRAGRPPTPSRLRRAIGLRLVATGSRLLGDVVRVR
jgi:hypothetical protein